MARAIALDPTQTNAFGTQGRIAAMEAEEAAAGSRDAGGRAVKDAVPDAPRLLDALKKAGVDPATVSTLVGDRLLLPLEDPGSGSHVHIAAGDPIAKRIIVRTVAAGGQVTVHTTDVHRWSTIRMPCVVVTDQSRPIPGTTVSVVDGTVSPTPRATTVISVGDSASVAPSSADVVITQTGPASVEVRADGRTHDVEMELFRAENRYAASEAAMTA